MENNECCPRLDPTKWDNQIFDWKDKIFIKGKVFTFMYIPINFGNVITKLMKKVEHSNANVDQNLCLSDHTSKWNMDIYLAVDKEVEGAENVKLNGKFISKVYEGEFQDTGKWYEDFNNYAKEKNYNIKKQYMWYTTCPKCAKKYGKNYTVIFGEIS